MSQNVPKMIYGTAWKKEQTAHYVQLALECGFRAIDTACQPKHYNEKQVGEGIQKASKQLHLNKEDIFLQTKFTPKEGQDLNNIPYNPTDPLPKQICDSLEISLSNLQRNSLDSLLLHSPLFPRAKTIEAWEVFETFVQEKKVKQIGISNCYDLELLQYLYQKSTIKPKVLQNRFYAQTSYDKEIRDFCISHDISYQSFWSLSANPHILHSNTLFKIAQYYRKTPEQIFYRFLTQINITPLNGTTSKIHMQEDLSIENFTLTLEEIANIQSLLV